MSKEFKISSMLVFRPDNVDDVYTFADSVFNFIKNTTIIFPALFCFNEKYIRIDKDTTKEEVLKLYFKSSPNS